MPKQVSKPAGFTLIELLVVIVLLGLLTGVAVTTIGGGNQTRELKNEADRLHALLRMAANEAIFTNEEIGVIIDTTSYQFAVYDEENGKWTESDNNQFRPRELPEWMVLEFQREGEKRELPSRESKQDEEADSDLFDQGKSLKPSMMLLSSGEVTEFTIRLSLEADPDTLIEIKADENDEIVFSDMEG